MESKSDNMENQKQKILDFIEVNGPGLPIRIASNLRMDSILVSAFLSEMLSDKKLFLSHMKVGSSPIYFMRGQEFQLIEYSRYLGDKEKESFELLKNYQLLEDNRLPPPIRVALRTLKDFAYPLDYKGNLYWRFLKISEERAIELIKEREIKPIIQKKSTLDIKPQFIDKLKQIVIPKEEEKQELVQKGIQTFFKREIPRLNSGGIEIEKRPTEFIEGKNKKEKLLLQEEITKNEKVKEKSDFVLEIISFLKYRGFEINEEIEFKKKEYLAKVKTNWNLGNVNLFVIGKDKKTVSENDLTLALQKCHEEKMPVLLIGRGEIKGKAELKMQEIGNLVFYEKLK